MSKFSTIKELEFTEKHLIEAYNIEKENPNYSDEMISPVDVIINWHKHNPYTTIGIKSNENDELAGYITALPLQDNIFQKFLNGECIDTYLSIDNIMQYNKASKDYKLYLCSIGINPKYKNSEVFQLLLKAFFTQIINLAIYHGIYFSEVIADTITSEGSHLCEIIGMEKVKNTNHNSNIFYIKTKKLKNNRLTKNFLKMYKKYEK